MSVVKRTIKLKKLTDPEKVEAADIQYDSDSHEITVTSGYLKNKVYSDRNLYRSFLLLNKEWQKMGYLPLCNGARKNVSLSGGLADVAGGAMLYVDDKDLGYPVVYIFDECKESEVYICE